MFYLVGLVCNGGRRLIEGPAAADRIAADELIETVPTTAAGLLAMLVHLEQVGVIENDHNGLFQEEVMSALLSSLAKCAKALKMQAA